MRSEEQLPPGVTVTGTGRVGTAPDVVLVSLACVARAPSVRAALDAAGAAAGAVAASLRSAGVADRDIRTSGMRVEQAWEHGPDGSRPRGFEAVVRVSARVRDVTAAGAAVTAAVEAGGDAVRVDQVALAVDDPSAAERSARELAVEDARSKAAHYAQLAGASLGAVVSVVDGHVDGGPSYETFALHDTRGSGVPVEAGEQDVVVSVTVRWSLA